MQSGGSLAGVVSTWSARVIQLSAAWYPESLLRCEAGTPGREAGL